MEEGGQRAEAGERLLEARETEEGGVAEKEAMALHIKWAPASEVWHLHEMSESLVKLLTHSVVKSRYRGSPGSLMAQHQHSCIADRHWREGSQLHRSPLPCQLARCH